MLVRASREVANEPLMQAVKDAVAELGSQLGSRAAEGAGFVADATGAAKYTGGGPVVRRVVAGAAVLAWAVPREVLMGVLRSSLPELADAVDKASGPRQVPVMVALAPGGAWRVLVLELVYTNAQGGAA